MLTRLKRTSDRAEKAIRRIFGSPTPEPPKIELRYTEWEGLKALVASLNQDPGPFEPLASVIGQLSTYVEKYDVRLRTRSEYAQQGADLDDLCLELGKCISPEPLSSVSFESIANFAQALDYEVKTLPDEEEGGNLEGEEATTTINVHIALKRYTRIRKLLALFVMSENTKLWKIGAGEIEVSYEQHLLPRISELYPAQGTQLVALPHAPEAHYRYAGPGAVPRNGCMPNTRVAVLQELRDWVYYGRSQNILWLNGTAGTGKTTVAHSLCKYLEGSGRLSASFFCSRRHPSCRDVDRIVPSISYQLARQSRPYQFAVSRVLGQDPEVMKRSVDEQLEKLIFAPLHTVAHTFNADPVIVIDGLDQCDDLEAAKCALDTILALAPDLPVRFLVSSCPTSGIRSRMRSSQRKRRLPLELRLHEQDRTVVQGDIRAYLTVELKNLALSTDDLEQLVQRVGVLFFYAAIVVGYVSDSEEAQSGTERLNDLLDISSSNNGIQNQETTYAYMLERLLGATRSATAESGEVKLVIGTLVSAQEQLSVNAIAGLLGLDLGHMVGNLLRSLLPVLRVSPTDSRAIFLDESFAQYLSNSLSIGELLLDEGELNKRLVHACFKVISSVDPPFNICNLESSYLEDREVPDLSERVQEAIPPELLYACRRWAGHMMLVGQSSQTIGDFEAFLSTRLLLWMEILNLKRCTGEGVEILSSARAWTQGEMGLNGVQDAVEDARYFVESFTSGVVSGSTPHIYLSQLQFWPENKWISECYLHQLRNLVNQSHADGHTESISSVCYSPDGAYIASGSYDNTVRTWDVRSGKPVGQPLIGHTGRVSSVAYSPDGAYIASGSHDKTIRIWDAHTGEPVGQPLAGHTDEVNSVAYSPDGACIASGSDDKTIRIWDARTGKSVGQPLTGHTGLVMSVAYSPDGAYIASGSYDNTIRIWDARTGEPVGQPLTGHISSVISVAYSPDGAYIASGSYDDTIRIWDARTSKPVGQPLTGHTHWVLSVAYSPDGAYIASGSYDKIIRIWDARTGKPVGQPLTGHTWGVRSVAYSPDGAYIVSGSYDNTIRIWFAPTQTEPKEVQPSTPSRRPAIDPFRPAVIPPITASPLDWTLNEDGWVVGPRQERLIWVPPDLREQVAPPNIKAIMSTKKPSIAFDFRQAKLGLEWQDCYKHS
ncbi:hypothetical protein FRC09_002100 [Ceratobasidium sp. 395]|nr:hypothetical protein FRC09_002100 [Ceratobasidium sp. 395]